MYLLKSRVCGVRRVVGFSRVASRSALDEQAGRILFLQNLACARLESKRALRPSRFDFSALSAALALWRGVIDLQK